MEDAVFDALFEALPLLVIGGLVAQWVAIRRFSGNWRLAAWVSVVVTTAAVAVAVLGVMAGSDLAPIWVVLAVPLCLLWLAGLWLVRGLAGIARG